MELDRKVREFPIPADASAFLEDIKAPADPDEEIPLSVSMTRFVLSHTREVSEYHVLSSNAAMCQTNQTMFSLALYSQGIFRASYP